MLKWLHITNIALIAEAQIPFEKGFNILTGETGAGKTALTQALSLLLGHKVDPKMIRSGCDKALVEAAFDIETLLPVQKFLEENGIEVDSQDYLIIRRDLSLIGKSRSSIGGHLVSSSMIQQLSRLLIEMATQNATAELRQASEQLKMVDLFGGLADLLKEFSGAYRTLGEKERQLTLLLEEESRIAERLELYQHQYNEICALGLKTGEEEALFVEYQTLCDFKKKTESLSEIYQNIEGFPSLKPLLTLLNRLPSSDKVSEVIALLESASHELSESSFILSTLLTDVSFDEQRFEEIESRLSAIHTLKKKYPHFEEKERELKGKLSHLETMDSQKAALQKEIATLKSKVEVLSKNLTLARQKSASAMAESLSETLHSLNLPSAKLLISIEPSPRSHLGDNSALFSLAANPGEPAVALSDRVSGGELARIFFALKLLFADKENLPILIFDEVDANIGGKTATYIGKKLQELGKCRQVIAITHFPQVASEADHHLSVEKYEDNGRTCTRVRALPENERHQELLRMVGCTESLQAR